MIELLVTIAIITILASVLLPALNQAREKGKKIKCANNLKQVSLAMLAYTTDAKDFLPAGEGSGIPVGYADSWDRVLLVGKYLGENITAGGKLGYNNTIMFCPSDTLKRSWGGKRTYVGNRGHWSYLCGWIYNFQSIKTNEIKRPSSFILLGELMQFGNIAGYFPSSSLDRATAVSPHAKPGDKSTGNYAYSDGHVNFLDRGTALSMDIWSRSGKWENLSNRWE